jgi:hypothetical protein
VTAFDATGTTGAAASGRTGGAAGVGQTTL